MSIFVARVTALKEETHNLMDINDLEDLVIRTMGEDTWNAIMYFTTEKIQENIDEAEYTKNDVRDYDGQLSALRGGVREELDVIDKLIDKIKDAKRLSKLTLIKELDGIHKRLYDNEGY